MTQQIQRSAVLIPSNIAEGSQRSSKRDFARFLNMAKSSGSELETQLIISMKLLYVKNITLYEECMDLLLEIRKMLSVLYSRNYKVK